MFVKNKNAGFSLLYAALISSVLLGLSVAISNIISKELVLSSISRESQKAFYAADSAAECALYWDFRHGKFNPAQITPPNSNILCQGIDISSSASELDDGVAGLGGTNTSKFKLEKDGLCAIVTVTKRNVAPKTTIEARGYNLPCDSVSKIKLERAVKLEY